MRNYFILDGVDSRDFGVYISGQGTFSAPQKAYTFYNIPGRNGALLGNEHRLENISVSYEAFIYSNFDENIAAFRTFLLSLNGYKRLTDSYHPDEYRMAVYVGPFEPKVQRTNDCGSFTITFACKPQRWLMSGDTVYSWVNGGEQVVSGYYLRVYVPKLDSTYFHWAYDYHTTSVITSSSNVPVTPDNPKSLAQFRNVVVYFNGSIVYNKSIPWCTRATLDFLTGTGSIYCEVVSVPKTGWTAEGNNIYSRTLAYDDVKAISHYSKAMTSTFLQYVQYGFYYNSGDNKLYVKDTRFNNNVSSFMAWVSSASVMMDVELPSAETFTVEAFTPTYPAVQFMNVTGTSQHETFYMKYTDSDSMSNPTAFPSQPLIRVYGNGSFTMDGITVTVSSASSYTDIDCEAMDCYEGSTNRNNDVSFSTYDFPTLQPGDNAVTIISGITAVEITPRWWQV